MLQVVMGLCNQTLRQSEDLPQFENLFLGRIQALARVYEVVQRDGWTQVSVHDLVDAIVSRVIGGERYDLQGDSAYIPADAGTGFGLVIHELAEGARQRGVASAAGRLDVHWEVRAEDGEGESLIVHWREHGPAVQDHALSPGIIERLQRQLRHELNGSIQFENAPGALCFKLRLPLQRSNGH